MCWGRAADSGYSRLPPWDPVSSGSDGQSHRQGPPPASPRPVSTLGFSWALSPGLHPPHHPALELHKGPSCEHPPILCGGPERGGLAGRAEQAEAAEVLDWGWQRMAASWQFPGWGISCSQAAQGMNSAGGHPVRDTLGGLALPARIEMRGDRWPWEWAPGRQRRAGGLAAPGKGPPSFGRP